jgi:hypothetical protein
MKKCFSWALSLLLLSYTLFQGNIVQAAGASVAPSSSEVTITNNVGKADTIYITGVTKGDIVTVYNAATEGKVIGKKSVTSVKGEATISVAQLGSTEGSVYVTVTSLGMTESSRTEISYSGEGESEEPLADNITITNNSGKADTIYVCGLAPSDKINIYTAAIGGKLLGSATVGGSKTDVTKSISQLGLSSGSIYVSVTTKGMHESGRVKADFSAEGQSEILDSNNVKITNNSGKADTIYIWGLAPGDKVKIYTAATAGKLLSSATVGANKTEATLTISQLGTDSGYVYISVASSGMLESSRTKVKFSAESESGSISTGNVTITNNSDKADTIYVTGITSGDTVNIYNVATDGRLLGSTTASSDGTATVSIGQLGTSAGSVYISTVSPGMLESSRVKANYSEETQSNTVDTENITVTNNAAKSDTVYVSGVVEGDVVKVYSSATGNSLLGTATVASGDADATITISQLGISAGSIYVSITGTNKLEGDRVQVDYSAETKSSSADASNVVVTNNSGKADIVYVSNLTAADVVKVYDSASSGNLLGTATVGDSNTEATISINQLGTAAGSTYVSVTGKGKSESSRVKIDYSAENKSKTLNASNIIITNNVGTADTVQVSGISSNQVVNVYDAAKGGNLLGTATVASVSTEATVTISQLSSEAGSIYVSLIDTNKLESDRVKVDYSAETKSDELNADNISITNKSVSADTVSLTGLAENDVIKVYDLAKGGNLLGLATVATGDTKATVSIAQLGTSLGSVYVSRISSNKAESDRVKVDYLAEPTSSTPKASNIIITNNAGIADTVQVTGISANDIVNVYDAAKGGNLIGSATVASTGTEGTVSIDQLGTDAGSIYVSITSTSKLESSRTQVGFFAESKSTAPKASKITIVNNAGIAGTVTVNGLNGNDIVNIYDAATGSNLLGSGTVGIYDTEVTVPVTQLASDGGNVFVSVTSKGKLESDRTEAAYAAKLVSSASNAENVTVENNAGIKDTVEVVSLQPNDIVKVYDSGDSGNLLGSATVSADGMEATVTITQLGVSSGTIYVSVTSTGKTESSRTKVQYNAESQSDALVDGDIIIENNSGTSDIIDITGVSTNDIVKVYSAATGGSLLGTATVASGDSEAIVTISQLGTNTGSVYVSVTRLGKTESSRTKADYLAESTAPVGGNISIVNNAVISDTVTVKGIAANDIVKVYDSAQDGNLLGYAISANGEDAVVTISQLTTVSGSVYVSVTNFGKGESKRIKADYISEQASTALYTGNISIANNTVGTSDVITVSNLAPSDVIKVYDASTGGNLIGTATVSSNGTQTIITIPQLSTAAGSVYISVTDLGKNESSRTKVSYVAEK